MAVQPNRRDGSWVKNIFGLTGARALASLAQALNLLLLARGSDPVAFGVVGAYVGVAMFLVAFFDMGVSTVILRHGRKGGQMSYTLASASSTVLVQAVVVGLLVLFLGVLGPWRSLGAGFACALAIWSAFERLSETAICRSLTLNRTGQAAAVTLVKRVAPLAIQVAALACGIGGIPAFGLSLLGGVLAGAPLLFGVVGLRAALRTKPFAYGRKESTLFWISSSASQTRELEAALVQAAAGPTAAGFFALAYRLQKPFSMLSITMGQLALPRISSGETRIGEELRSLVRPTLALLAFAVLAAAALPWVVPILIGAEYSSGVGVAQLGVLFAVPWAMCAPVGAALQGVGRAGVVATTGILAGIVGLVAASLGALVGGATGAVVGAGIVYSVKFLWLLVLARRPYPAN